MGEPFEILEHTADIGFRAWGETIEELFANAARAMIAIAAEPAEIEPSERRRVEIEANGYEELLVDWLSEVLYLFDADVLAPARFEVIGVERERLAAIVHGEKRDPARHPWALIVKAVTYHQLAVRPPEGSRSRWEAEVYLDV